MKPVNPLASLLRHSPFKPMQQHMRAVKQCVDEVPALFDALTAGDMEAVKAASGKIIGYEQAADEIKNTLRGHLPKSLFMPVDRRDLLELLEVQDAIAGKARDVAGLLVQRDMEVVEPMREPLLELVRQCVAAVDQATLVVEELDELVEMGFGGREAVQVGEMIDKLNHLESHTDELGMALTRTLFEHEAEMQPVSVMLWYRLVEWIGDIADNAEKVGDRLRLMIAR